MSVKRQISNGKRKPWHTWGRVLCHECKNHKEGKNKWQQQQQQTIKRSLWQSNKKKRAMRIGKQIKTFRRVEEQQQQLQDAHTCDPMGQEIHIACTKGATAKAKDVPHTHTHSHTVAKKNAGPKQRQKPKANRNWAAELSHSLGSLNKIKRTFIYRVTTANRGALKGCRGEWECRVATSLYYTVANTFLCHLFALLALLLGANMKGAHPHRHWKRHRNRAKKKNCCIPHGAALLILWLASERSSWTPPPAWHTQFAWLRIVWMPVQKTKRMKRVASPTRLPASPACLYPSATTFQPEPERCLQVVQIFV